MKVVHIITGLGDGGAEAVLYNLCCKDKANQHIVISLKGGGKYGALLQNKDIPVYFIEFLKNDKLQWSALLDLYKIIKKAKPEVVQTWMYHADFVGGLVAKISGVKFISWGIHNAILDSDKSKKSTVVIAKVCAFLSHFIPDKIVFCAESSKKIHNKLGYSKNKSAVIYNGYDLDKFKYHQTSKAKMRSEFELEEIDLIIGMVGRFDPYKDHGNLFQSLNLLAKKQINFKCLLVGTGMSANNEEITSLITQFSLKEKILLLGQRDDIPQVMSLLDIHVLSSSSEAFPNVLNEAMACGTPCITTDVGDAGFIVENTGWVVPAKNAEVLCEAIYEAFNEKSNEKSKWNDRISASRNRIVDKFSIYTMIKKYNNVWSSE